MIARFFRSDAMSERLGEVEDVLVESKEFFQLTYHALRDMEGEEVAWFDHMRDTWKLSGSYIGSPNLSYIEFSDVVIYNPQEGSSDDS